MPINKKEFKEEPKHSKEQQDLIINILNLHTQEAFNREELSFITKIPEWKVGLILKFLYDTGLVVYANVYGRRYYQLASNGFENKINVTIEKE